jgi:hypothetical protein
MRLVVPVALAVLSSASLARAQSQVDQTGSSSPENATAQSPLPGAQQRDVPSRPDPQAVHEVSHTPAEAKPLLRPGAPYQDPLSRHWFLGASASYGTVLGNFSSKVPIGDRLGDALIFGLDVGYGLTTHWELALAGDFSLVSDGDSCSVCEAASYGAGPRLRYHLVGGTRFSPWVSYGFSLRQTSLDQQDGSASFTALEPVRLELGGNWYVTSNFLLGPVLAAGVARSVSTTDDQGSGRWQVQLSAGLRIALDPTGR